MTILETNERLAETYSEACYFLRLDQAARVDSDWFKGFVAYPSVRSFFKQSVFGKGAVLQVAAVTQIAHAYVACFEREPSEPLPTAAAVRGLMRKAGAFESELAAESSSWVPSELEKSFRGSLKSLRDAASTVERRSAGRPAFSERRIFVLHLARALYGMCDDFPGRFIATVAARVWEDTDDRTVRKILTDDERDAIKRHAAENRRLVAESENTTQLLLNRASIPPKAALQAREPQTTSEIFEMMLALAKRIPDETTSISAVNLMHMLRDEAGIEPDFPAE
ncbi:hypothetical protein [Paraburkholderia tagetis]|uniref:Uncharacterized protein n=1 Tax=Paraburkholderia tagetis TaxID=2913261 RepID=A0A9X1ULW9_9BURK|nr:hypothetical protein [Paraburkholderia tagetis]MCG5077820.1 hypothetical protein [Paraburkholderia tagetis]